jgi:periplasmic divalent cation tolerance protein
VEAAIREMHSYDVPEILAVEAVTGSGDYLKWVTETVAGPHG